LHCDRICFWPKVEKYEIVFASRFKYDESVNRKQPFARTIISRLSNLLIRYELKTDLRDTQCGFKLFSANAIKKIFPEITIDRFGFDMEIVAIAKVKGLKIAETAVNWTNAPGSKVRAIRDLRRSLIDLAVIKDNVERSLLIKV